MTLTDRLKQEAPKLYQKSIVWIHYNMFSSFTGNFEEYWLARDELAQHWGYQTFLTIVYDVDIIWRYRYIERFSDGIVEQFKLLEEND